MHAGFGQAASLEKRPLLLPPLQGAKVGAIAGEEGGGKEAQSLDQGACYQMHQVCLDQALDDLAESKAKVIATLSADDSKTSALSLAPDECVRFVCPGRPIAGTPAFLTAHALTKVIAFVSSLASGWHG